MLFCLYFNFFFPSDCHAYLGHITRISGNLTNGGTITYYGSSMESYHNVILSNNISITGATLTEVGCTNSSSVIGQKVTKTLTCTNFNSGDTVYVILSNTSYPPVTYQPFGLKCKVDYPSVHSCYSINNVGHELSITGNNFATNTGSARVDIGNASTWGACTITVQQSDIVHWDTMNINFNLIQGTLSNGTNYIYITNSSGKRSDGFLIGIGTVSIENISNVGSTTTILGSGFRTKNPAEPVVFHNFDNGVNGSDLNTAKPNIGIGSSDYDWTFHNLGTSTVNPKYSNEQNPPNSVLTAKCHWEDGDQSVCSFGRAPIFSPASGTAYVYYKRYMVPSTDDIATCNIKQYYFFGNGFQLGTGTSDCPQGMILIPAGNSQWNWYTNYSDTFPLKYPVALKTFEETNNTWQTWESYLVVDDYTKNNGTVEVYLDGELLYWSHETNYGVRTGVFDDYRLGNMYGMLDADSEGEASCYFDNVYIDITQARVMVGNAPTFSASTRREIQIPTAWSSTEITFTVNQGSFANGEQAYLFVIDSDGNASAGYPVTFSNGQLASTATNTVINSNATLNNCTIN
jgi:hypothetical protein